jgi:hypothetical protein
MMDFKILRHSQNHSQNQLDILKSIFHNQKGGIMKRDKLVVILLVFIFGFMTSNHLHPRPRECPMCWQIFKNSTTTIILPVEKADDNTHLISLKNLRTELEKARIGDKLIVELKLGNGNIIRLGNHTPKVLTKGTSLLEKYNSMGKVSFLPPKGLKLIPTSGQLIIRDVSGRFKASKLVQLELNP